MNNPIRDMLDKRKIGIHCGIPSFCCANKLVIEAVLDQAKRFDDTVLIEATSNQVNQFKGYTGMTPEDFRDFVYQIADQIQFQKEKIILGGDHLGPQPWQDEPAEIAMAKAENLVRLSVKAGYQKIHLDTSMRLGDDDINEPLSDEIIAQRGARLYAACEEECLKMQNADPSYMHPVFVIGSEVPVPGGAQQENEAVVVTSPKDFENTLITYHKVFEEHGLSAAWKNIIAVVVQPGVEFGSDGIHHYNRYDSFELCNALRKYPDIVFEGHSTDYQAPVKLREMVEDGIAIIKVGPALTFALREALFALSCIEKEIIPHPLNRANFPEVLSKVMLDDPSKWNKHYHSTGQDLELEQKYSFSDRCRYYFALPEVENAVEKLFNNLDQLEIPLGLLRQYMPLQYIKVRDGKLSRKAKELAKDNIVLLVDDYNYAVKYNFVTSNIFVR